MLFGGEYDDSKSVYNLHLLLYYDPGFSSNHVMSFMHFNLFISTFLTTFGSLYPLLRITADR